MWPRSLTRAMAGAALLSILSVVPASAGVGPPPDRVRGVVAPVVTVDQEDLTGVACDYSEAVTPQLTHVRVAPAAILWPDRKPGVTTERGRVTWRVSIERARTLQWGPWTRIARSVVRSGTASEVSSPMLAGVKVPVQATTGTWVRAVHTVTWYRKDGRVLGTLRRVHTWYAWFSDGQEFQITRFLCPMTFNQM